MIQSINAVYQGVDIKVIVDGAGLDMILKNRSEESAAISQELFEAVVDNYRSMGLGAALENAGALINVEMSA